MTSRRVLIVLVIILALALLPQGCRKTEGGGWIPIYDRDVMIGKATFGFQMRCQDLAADSRFNFAGQDAAWIRFNIEFQDGTTILNDYPVKFHASDKDSLGFAYDTPQRMPWVLTTDSCENIAADELPGTSEFQGFYVPQSEDGMLGPADGGTVYVYLEDRGEPGFSEGDYILVEVTGGIFDGYFLDGTLGGGNIQVK